MACGRIQRIENNDANFINNSKRNTAAKKTNPHATLIEYVFPRQLMIAMQTIVPNTQRFRPKSNPSAPTFPRSGP